MINSVSLSLFHSYSHRYYQSAEIYKPFNLRKVCLPKREKKNQKFEFALIFWIIIKKRISFDIQQESLLLLYLKFKHFSDFSLLNVLIIAETKQKASYDVHI